MSDGPTIRRGKSAQNIATPWAFIRAVEAEFGETFSWDLAAEATTAKAPRFYTREQDSFAQNWAGLDGLLWLNPEFDPITPWVRKCALEGCRGARIVMLSPASIGSNWFSEYVWPYADVIALNGRITFEGSPTPYPKDLMLSLYGHGRGEKFSTWRWSPADLI